MGCFMGTAAAAAEDVEEEEESDNELLNPMVLPSSRLLGLEFNDTIIKFSLTSTPTLQSPYSQKIDKIGRRATLIFNAELSQATKFKIGNEVLCMSWNMKHTPDSTPFDYYCDFRTLNLSERDSVIIEILWDIARVFFHMENTWELSGKTILSSLVPSALLSDDALDRFCSSVKLSQSELKHLWNLPNASILEFLKAHLFDEDINQTLHNESSFLMTHMRWRRRDSSPLLTNYNPEAWKDLLKRDPSLLPVLIMDSLHVNIIKFSHYLIVSNLRKAFSEFESAEQLSEVSKFCKQNDQNDLTLPSTFKAVKARLYDRWNLAFLNNNKVKQIWLKVDQTKADIILLQRLTKGVFKELVSKFSGKYAIVPPKFPSGVKETTAILLFKETVKLEKDKTRRMDERNFAVICNTSNIRYYVGVVHLTEGRSCGELRKKEVREWKRILGKTTPIIIGGDFNEDLTAFDNPVAQLMLKTYNGIDHTQVQNESLALITRTRTNLQFHVGKSDKLEKGVTNGIFSSCPLKGEAFTDFLYSGHKNPSDCGPVFQRVMLTLL